MKRLSALLALACLAGALVAPAEAAKTKTFKHKLYLHGTNHVGESEIPDTWVNDLWMKMDEKKPAAGAPKSINVTNYVGGPNTDCSGNGLLPIWQAPMKGTIKGNVTLELHTIASPASELEARLYGDANGGCDEAAMAPGATAVVDVDPGHSTTKVTFKKVNIKVLSRLVLQLNAAGDLSTGQIRVLYDEASFASALSITCIKKKCL